MEKNFKNLALGRINYLNLDDKHFVCKDRRDALNYCLFRTGENGGKCKFLASVRLPAELGDKETAVYDIITNCMKNLIAV